MIARATNRGPQTPRKLVNRWLSLILITLSIGVTPAVAQQQRQAAPQVQMVQLGVKSMDSQIAGLGLPRAPREMRRELSRAQRAIDDGRFADAVEALSRILQDPNAEDYFLFPQGEEDGQQSLKSAARDLLGTLPPAGREIYELQAGSTARRLLNDAVQARDFGRLNEVSRRYFHTKAGYEATYLMGRYCLDQNRPVAAAIHLKRLRDVGSASHEFEPDLSFYLATSWLLARNDEAAFEALAYLQQLAPGVSFDVAGQRLTLPTDQDRLLTWLGTILAGLSETMAPSGFDWIMYRGEPARNGKFEGDSPIPKLEWNVDAAALPEYAEMIEAELRAKLSAENAPIASMHPLAIDETVLMRTPHMLFGVNLKSGKRVWQFPWDTPEIDANEVIGRFYQNQRPQEDRTQKFVLQRMWQDGVHGQLSSNGSTVFLLHDLKPLGSVVDNGAQFNLLRRGFVAAPPSLKENANQLIALDLAAEGKTRWIVGGKDGESPTLEGAFFLGAPLPLGQTLYIIAELQDEIRLCALNAENGALEWTQQIAQVESPFAWYFDPVRRLAGSSPSYADGIMVCPTSSGVVVAVDLDARSLLWAYEYKRDATDSAGTHRIARQQTASSGMPDVGQRWCDSAVVIVGGNVLMTPADSDSLHCLDLLSGSKRWTKKRTEYVFLGGVYGDTVVLVGQNKVQGIGLSNGRAVWEKPLELPEGALPSGHGFLSDHVFHLPTTQSELLRIDVKEGRLIERVPTGEVLGNLICHGDYIISQSVTGLRAFLRRDRARDIVESRLQDQPGDVETWETYGSLLLGDGKVEQAIDAMRRALEIAESPSDVESVRLKLVDLLLRQLEQGRDDLDVEEVERLAESIANRKRFHHIMIQRKVVEGDIGAAIDHCFSRWQLMGTTDVTAKPLVVSGPQWRVSERVWIRQQFDDLLARLDSDQREQIVQQMRTRIQDELARGDHPREREWLDALPASFGPSRSTLEEVDQLLSEGQFLEAQLRLLPLLDASEPDIRANALASLGRLYKLAGSHQLAADALSRVQPQRGDADAIDAAESNEALLQKLMPSGLADYHHWPTGAVEYKEIDTPLGQIRPPLAVAVRAEHEWPDGWTLTYDNQEQRLEVRDELGNVVRIAKLPSQRNQIRVPTYARAYGQLIVFNMVNRVIAIDAIGERYNEGTRVLWTSDDPEFAGVNSTRNESAFRAQRIAGPFGQTRMVSPQILGPVSGSGVCFLQQDTLRCADPLTGATLWLRDNLAAGRTRAERLKPLEVYGDQQHVFVQTSGESTARVFRMLDGADLGEVVVPSNQWAQKGRVILGWQRPMAQPAIILQGYDALTEKVIWEMNLPRGTQGTLVEDDEFATITPAGKLEIRRIEDGEVRVEKQLDPVAVPRNGLHVSRSTHDYLVMVSDEPQRQHWPENGKNITITPAATHNQMPSQVSGLVFAVSRETGEDLWKEPLEVRNFFVPNEQPIGTPYLALMRNVAVDNRSQVQARRVQREQHTGIAVIDRRDGEVIFLKQDLREMSRMFTMAADWNNRRLTIQLKPRKLIQLALTDEPRLESSRLLPRVAVEPSQDVADDDTGERELPP